MKLINTFYLLLLFPCLLFSQSVSRKNILFSNLGTPQNQVNIGGLNAPQFSEVDLNNDGIKDLFIFDRIGNVRLTFLNNNPSDGNPSYTFAPEYINGFPELFEWVLLRDYDGDGIVDIFSNPSTPGVPGLEVYKGFYENNKIHFTKHQAWEGSEDILYFQTTNGLWAGIYVSTIDYPSVVDIDNDTDLDILTFNPSGGYVELFKNNSIELGYGRDSLKFSLTDNCWGNFYESGLSEAVSISLDPNSCALSLTGNVEFRHSGSTVANLDMDNDGDQEIFLGDISFNNITMLRNGGSQTNAYITYQDTFFPNNVPVNLPIFPATFFLDVNNDNKKDMIVAPNNVSSAEDYNVVWYYKNIGTNQFPNFELQRRDLFVNETVDIGSGCHPIFVDYNNDGLMDIVAGNFSYYKPFGERDARLFLFKNVGSPTQPAYELLDDNYLNFSQFSANSWSFVPYFADMDGDGDKDLLVGEEYGQLFYGENIPLPNGNMNFPNIQYGYAGIDVGQASSPFVIDLNRDGLLDLIIGERQGNLNYFQNIGNITSPSFINTETTPPNSNFLGQVDTRDLGSASGLSSARFLDYNGQYSLYCGSQTGYLKQYNSIEGNLNGAFNRLSERFANVTEGGRTVIDFADIDNDSLYEMVVGNFRGGMSFYDTDIRLNGYSSNTKEPDYFINFSLSPNPTTGYVQLDIQNTSETNGNIIVYDMLGRLVFNSTINFQTDEIKSIDLSQVPAGIYIVQITSNNIAVSNKIVKE